MKTHIMKHSHIYTGVGALIVGTVLGYVLWGSGAIARDTVYPMHTMSTDTSMHGTMDSMVSGLSGKTGDAFDQAFLAEMIVHHEGAVAMANQVLATSKRPELIKLAHDIIAAQTGEIQMMKDWQVAWFK
jgi:uncharacterized protein (DUF305 family)